MFPALFEAKDHVGRRCASRNQRQCDYEKWSCLFDANQCIHCFSFPRLKLIFEIAGPEEAKEPGGEKVLHLIQIRLAPPSVRKCFGFCQNNSSPPMPYLSSRNAVNFSSARTLNLFYRGMCISPIALHHLRVTSAHFNLCPYFLYADGQRFNLPLLSFVNRLLFVVPTVLF